MDGCLKVRDQEFGICVWLVVVSEIFFFYSFWPACFAQGSFRFELLIVIFEILHLVTDFSCPSKTGERFNF